MYVQDDAWVDIDANEDAAMFVESVNNGKRKVPTILFEDGSILVVPSNAELAEKFGLIQDLGHEFHDIIIIGGGPAGLTAALYAARDGLDVVVVEKSSLGGQASYTERIDNYPGFPEGIAGGVLADKIVEQCEKFGVEFLKATEISKLKEVNGYLVAVTSTGREISAIAFLLATGSRYRKLNVPGEDDLIGYKLHFCSTCDGPFYRDKQVAVIGGGNSAFEESKFLARFASKVTIYGRSEWKASKVLLDKVYENTKIELVKNIEVLSVISCENKTLLGLKMKNNITGKEFEIKPDGVFLFIGLFPNAELVKNMVTFDNGGFVVTGNNMKTVNECLFAAGDVRSGSVKQAVSAMGEGAAAAIHMREYLNSH